MEGMGRGLVQEETGYKRLTTAVGLLILALGILGALWIAHAIFTLSTAPHAIPLLEKLLAFDDAARTIRTPDGPVQLPEAAYFTVGLFLYILLLAIAGILAKALIASGTRLLQFDVTPLANRLRDEIRTMKEHWEKRSP